MKVEFRIVKKVWISLGLALLIVCGLQSTAKAQALEKVLITHSSDSVSIRPLLYGIEKGFYRKEGIDLQFIAKKFSLDADAADETYKIMLQTMSDDGIKAALRANRFVRQNREGTIQTLMDWVHVDRESAAATYDSTWRIFSEDGNIAESGLRLVIDQRRQAMKIDRPVGIEEVADFAPLREAQKELGIKRTMTAADGPNA
jgi:hypothetical protein